MTCDLNQEAQENELLALDAIYDDEEFSQSQDGQMLGGEFRACLELPSQFQVQFGSLDITQVNDPEKVKNLHAVQHLPPIILYFQLPKDYPSCTSPHITLACEWLTLEQLSRLCQKLDDIWEENQGQEILFLWTNFLKDETLDFLELKSPLDLSKVCSTKQQHNKTMCSPQESNHAESDDLSTLNPDPRAIQNIAKQDLLLPTVLEYDKQCRQVAFDRTMITCHVCFVDKLGSQCLMFYDCEHTYCRECMKSYFEIQINDGNVNALTCPSDKCESQAHPSQVKELVSMEMFTRYDRLLLQSGLDTMSDIMYCPRKVCNYPVMVDQGSSMGSCPDCHYVFCILCKLAYHGLSPCRLKAAELEKLKEEYTSGTAEEKKRLELRYGKRVIHQCIEECFSRIWLENQSKPCPSCKARIQKIDGCNKMTCYKCRAHFCWLCAGALNAANPYSHFNTPGSTCFNALFRGVVIDDEDDDDWIEEEDFLLL